MTSRARNVMRRMHVSGSGRRKLPLPAVRRPILTVARDRRVIPEAQSIQRLKAHSPAVDKSLLMMACVTLNHS